MNIVLTLKPSQYTYFLDNKYELYLYNNYFYQGIIIYKLEIMNIATILHLLKLTKV